MRQEVSIISDPVMLHVWSCLHNFAYEDAVFAAERLFAETHSSESLHLLAVSLYRIGRPKQASHLLTSVESLSSKCRYLLSKCHFDFGLLNEAEDALLGHSFSPKPLDELIEAYGEQAAYAVLLLGNIRRKQGKLKEAIICYKKCLDLNPMIWSAFKNLCDIGEYANPAAVFQLRDDLCFPTPTYKYISSCTEGCGIQLENQSPLNSAANENVESEEIFCRENVNPDKHNIPLSALSTLKTLSESPANTTDRTFVTHVSKVTPFVDSSRTPEEKFLEPIIPKAPKPEHFRCPLLLLSADPTHSPDSVVPSTPRFGSLSLFAQSPMFACVPVFHKSLISSATVDSFFGSSKLGNQTLPLRHSLLNESVPVSAATKSTARDSLGTLNPPRRTSRIGDTAVSSITQQTSGSHVGNKCVSVGRSSCEKTTSTPACTASSLRRLVISDSPNSSSSFVHSGVPAINPCHDSPTRSRCEPPVLRSASQRTASIGANVVPGCADIHMSDFQSPTTNITSTAARVTSNRKEVDVPFSEELQATGPRTRSQVAAAVALARASGVQRRSDRSSRVKVTPKKGDSRGSLKTVPKVEQDSPDVDTNNKSSVNITQPAHVSFGEEALYKDVISMDAPVTNNGDPRISSMKGYLHLLSELGKAYQLLAQHNWKAATRLISKFSSAQLLTGRVLSWAARAHMDNADYVTAKKLFSEVRRLEPWQLLGMDYYSTVLWQLQADHELSLLSHELLQLDRSAPEPWCAAGNCFSLQGEHEIAIRFLQRAIQVCPTSAYAFTLLGHEQSTLEDFDRALNSFRHALRLDPRQYNALFGMSNVYYKQERFELADSHLSRAVALFPQSHLLLTNLGALRGRLGHLDDGSESALALLTKACKIQPNNPLARYHRASILFHLGKYSEVLAELQKLLILTPREAMVYLMIGHTHKKLGNTPQAMIHYSWAMGLDPKGANTHLRDIMTNPPIAGRGTSRGMGTSEPSGVENGNGPGRAARSRLDAVSSEVVSDEDDGLNDESLTDPDFLDSDLPHGSDDTMSGFLASSHLTGPVRAARDTRRLADFSLLFGTEAFDDPALSGLDDPRQHETMDLGGELDNDAHDVDG